MRVRSGFESRKPYASSGKSFCRRVYPQCLSDPAPLEGDAEHVTVSLATDPETVAAARCRMFGKLGQFRNMDSVRQTAMFDCVTRR